MADAEKAQKIVDEIADTGRSLRSVCEEIEVKPSTFLRWVSEDEKLAKHA